VTAELTNDWHYLRLRTETSQFCDDSLVTEDMDGGSFISLEKEKRHFFKVLGGDVAQQLVELFTAKYKDNLEYFADTKFELEFSSHSAADFDDKQRFVMDDQLDATNTAVAELSETGRKLPSDLPLEDEYLFVQAMRWVDKLSSGTAVSGHPPRKRSGKDERQRRKSSDSAHKKKWSVEIISKLSLHHQYDQDSCLNLEPLGVRKLGRELNCSASVVSEFFKREFDDYKSYAQMCRNAGLLAKAISMLRGELRPSILNQRLPGNDGRDIPDR